MDLPAEKESLDLNLGDQPQLNIAQTEEPEQPVPAVADNAPAQTPFGGNVLSDAVTPMNPNEAVGGEQKEITETIKELVPGKKIEPQREDDGLISQADLAEAFTERTPTEEFPLPEETQSPAEEVESFQQETLAEAPAPQNPNDLTEVELKEGSTYLISDFIPPAQTSGAAAQSALPKEYGGAASEDKKEEEKEEAVEEILTSKKDEADLTVSKVILENTIKTKRGATMDIKTVPMVKEPGDSNRLDLTDSDLDINTQHDMKAADIKPGSSKGTKIVLGSAVSVIILALIYVMLGYLEILPPQFNFIKSSSSAQEQQALDEQLNEMLPQQPEQAPADMPQAMPQDYTQQMPQAGLQPGQQQMPAGAMQPGMPQQAYGQNAPMMPVQPAANPLDPILAQVQNFPLANGQTLQQLINSRHPAAQQMIEWNITTAVEPDNYSILVKIPPENPQSFKISYRFNYNTVTNTLDPTISDSKNLLDSVQAR